MVGLSDTKLSALRRLVAAAPDAVLRSLQAAMASGAAGGPSLAGVYAMIEAEMAERAGRAAVLAPILPLSAGRKDGFVVPALPSTAPERLWRVARRIAPTLCDRSVMFASGSRPDPRASETYDDICLQLAEEVRRPETASELAPLIETAGVGRARLAAILELAPVLRRVTPRLDDWTRNLSEENAAGVRVAFKDASALDEASGPLLLQILSVHLPQPWMVLRLISAVMDRPSDRYLAASELAFFGEDLMADVGRRIAAVRGFSNDEGPAAGRAAAVEVATICSVVGEFEQWIAIAREGPWGGRLAEHRRALAIAVEGRLREVEPLVQAALPTKAARLTGRLFRQAPKLNHEIDPASVRRAEAALAFLDATRLSAPFGGFGALRAKVLAALDERLTTYADDLLDDLHAAKATDQPGMRALLTVAATFTGYIKDEDAAGVLRRRSAAA